MPASDLPRQNTPLRVK